MFNYIAHTKDGKTYTNDDECQKLDEHLKNAAEYAEKYASDFDAGNEAYLIGLLHDVGKYQDLFQKRIRGQIKSIVDHSTQGAVEIMDLIQGLGEYYAMAIAGHHAGLKDANNKHEVSGNSFYARINDYTKNDIDYPNELNINTNIKPKILQPYDNSNIAFCIATYVKMLFSCLVDADWTDTEEYVKDINRKSIKCDMSRFFLHLLVQ